MEETLRNPIPRTMRRNYTTQQGAHKQRTAEEALSFLLRSSPYNSCILQVQSRTLLRENPSRHTITTGAGGYRTLGSTAGESWLPLTRCAGARRISIMRRKRGRC